jgi:hypothetical protein
MRNGAADMQWHQMVCGTVLSVAIGSSQSLAQTTPTAPSNAQHDALIDQVLIDPDKNSSPAAPARTALARSLQNESLLGVDRDNDGVRDDIEAIVTKHADVAAAQEEQQSKDPQRVDLQLAGVENRTARREPPRRSCFDYLLLSPKDQYKADLRMRQQTNNVTGTHPCDPVMSPLRERPFETDFLHLDLGPVQLRY